MIGNKFIKVIGRLSSATPRHGQTKPSVQATETYEFDPFLPWEKLTEEERIAATAHLMTLEERKTKPNGLIRFLRKEHR